MATAQLNARARPWNLSVHPLVGQITIKGVPDVTSLTSGLLTGAIQDSYDYALPTLGQLEHSATVRVWQGPGWSTDAFIVSSFKGVLGNLKVREALSLALNRRGIINSVYKGAGLMPRWVSNPGTFGYGKPAFAKAYDSSPVLTQNIAEAKKLVQRAGATGKTFTIGTTSQSALANAAAGAYQAAAQAIGLKVKLKSVSAQNYINFFTDPKFRAGVEASRRWVMATTPARRRCLPGSNWPAGWRTTPASTTRRSPRTWSRPAAPPTRTSGRRW